MHPHTVAELPEHTTHPAPLRPSGVPPGRRVWWGALALFVVAGLTGAFFRFGMTYGWTGGLRLVNVRHAHSHLMYFGWVTPALMALIWHYLPTSATREYTRAFRWIVGGTFGAAILAYPPFLLFGYTPVEIGTARMPIAVVGAGLNIFGWYGFTGLYTAASRGLARTQPLQLWDMALTFLVLATLGAWGLALMKPFGLHDPLVAKALTHVFLDLFSEGWFVLALLGVAHAILLPDPSTARSWAFRLVGAGLPFTFALALPAPSLPPVLKVLACTGGAMVAAGLLVIAVCLGRALPVGQRWLWGLPLGLLALKALAQLANSTIPGVWWAGAYGLRILYLHLMLLGFVSLGLVAAARHAWGRGATRSAPAFYTAVLVLLASLVPLTTWWPAAWTGRWADLSAPWVTLGPLSAAAVMLARGLYDRARHRKYAIPVLRA